MTIGKLTIHQGDIVGILLGYCWDEDEDENDDDDDGDDDDGDDDDDAGFK